jgi:hypothetical protein
MVEVCMILDLIISKLLGGGGGGGGAAAPQVATALG